MCIVMDKLDGGDLVEGLQRHLKDWFGHLSTSCDVVWVLQVFWSSALILVLSLDGTFESRQERGQINCLDVVHVACAMGHWPRERIWG